ncbi:hypothetical protein CVT25_005802 [Psilocybe cyanescens]|uniref:Uncharacterized protein n=1 Tax=Psilocybe cyanescens TaxID=93625 RepID=A0A409XAA7_PSICY|nr:hypothetical protein CVT25_005802 [Psilocybe cyanescens]
MSTNRQNPAKASKVKAFGNRLKKYIGFGSRRTASPPAVGDGLSSAVAIRAVEATVSHPVVGDELPTARPSAVGHGSSSAVLISVVEAAELRAKYEHFRILVIGRANAGKTTLLKRVCNTTEEPSIYDDGKNLVSYSALCQMSDTYHAPIAPTNFKSNTPVEPMTYTEHSHLQFIFHDSAGFEAGGEEELKAVMDFIEKCSKARKFIFHDSAGFEAGGEEELKAVMDFIEKCSKARKVDDQIHIIWYPDVSRPLLDLEVKFFSENRKWNSKLVTYIPIVIRTHIKPVPVVAIFMKFDDLISQVWDRNKTLKQNTMHALDTLSEKFEQPLRSYPFPPRGYVQLEELDKNESDHQKQIGELMKQTAASIDDLALKMLFVTVQQNNLKICIEHAIKHISKLGPRTIPSEIKEIINAQFSEPSLNAFAAHSNFTT